MSLDVAVLLWGALVALIVATGIVTGEWREKLYYTRSDSKADAE
jgi:hypothetical protein